MEELPAAQFTITEHSARGYAVTRGRVRERAVELAVIGGRAAHEASGSDWEQAKRELIGEPDSV
jgi:hypothetical protein